ncbi:DNA processing protein [Sphingomonas gellani]|uniref:DNA processing protein n=1 Tax=Sphingomonas gellani TaxID=1166340 RepID=A0A1H7Z754_9SPHN|nr:DNA-processing protein DprA [Sphingomonas gellani]SEM54115.1 DNA processing protein [Sphingomonas gellani]
MEAESDRPRRPSRPVTRPAISGGSRGLRYVPPAEVFAYPLTGLLAISGREALADRQMDMLASVTASDEGGRAQVFYAGDAHLIERRCVAVIGARKASDMGRRRARQLGRQLAEAGIVVVSGLAEGIDTEALSGAMEAGGKVIAVIGTPIDQAYPAKNKTLQEAIYRDHLLISQFASGSRVFPSNFPARNRTMAALSDASVVIEASDTSGTLHQAAECQRLGRWLVIARSVADDPGLSWPAKFIDKPRTLILESTPQLLAAIYGG